MALLHVRRGAARGSLQTPTGLADRLRPELPSRDSREFASLEWFPRIALPDDLGDYLNCYFDSPPCPQADFNGDGGVDPDDLGDYLNVFFGPPC